MSSTKLIMESNLIFRSSEGDFVIFRFKFDEGQDPLLIPVPNKNKAGLHFTFHKSGIMNLRTQNREVDHYNTTWLELMNSPEFLRLAKQLRRSIKDVKNIFVIPRNAIDGEQFCYLENNNLIYDVNAFEELNKEWPRIFRKLGKRIKVMSQKQVKPHLINDNNLRWFRTRKGKILQQCENDPTMGILLNGSGVMDAYETTKIGKALKNHIVD